MKKCINKDALIFNTEDWLYILKIQYEHGNCLLIAMAWRPTCMLMINVTEQWGWGGFVTRYITCIKVYKHAKYTNI